MENCFSCVCVCSIDLMKEEGGGSIELIPGGREIQVTTQNLFDYIKRYTEYRLIKTQDKALEVINIEEYTAVQIRSVFFSYVCLFFIFYFIEGSKRRCLRCAARELFTKSNVGGSTFTAEWCRRHWCGHIDLLHHFQWRIEWGLWQTAQIQALVLEHCGEDELDGASGFGWCTLDAPRVFILIALIYCRPFSLAGVFLDWFACSACLWGGLSAIAIGDHSSRWWHSFAHGQYMHIATLHTALLE